MSGLTVGYSSINLLELEITLKNGTPEKIANAKKILPIIEKKHLLLATLLLSNALAMESLPIFLDAIMPATLAIILSTTIVLIFGEVVPQAICLGENQIKIAATLAPFVRILILVLSPICYPISKGLDYVLGTHDETVRFAKKDLKALMELHQNNTNPHHEGLTDEEIAIINSTIDIRNTNVDGIMVQIDKCFRLNKNTIITDTLMERIVKKNYSRIPIFDKDNKCLGFVKTKSLVTMYKNKNQNISSLKLSSIPIYVGRNTNLLEALRIMQESRTCVLVISDIKNQRRKSFAIRSRNDMIVKKKNSKTIGFVFLKDIFEEIIKTEIHDQDIHFDSKAQFVSMKQKEEGQKREEENEAVELKEYNEPLIIK